MSKLNEAKNKPNTDTTFKEHLQLQYWYDNLDEDKQDVVIYRGKDLRPMKVWQIWKRVLDLANIAENFAIMQNDPIFLRRLEAIKTEGDLLKSFKNDIEELPTLDLARAILEFSLPQQTVDNLIDYASSEVTDPIVEATARHNNLATEHMTVLLLCMLHINPEILSLRPYVSDEFDNPNRYKAHLFLNIYFPNFQTQIYNSVQGHITEDDYCIFGSVTRVLADCMIKILKSGNKLNLENIGIQFVYREEGNFSIKPPQGIQNYLSVLVNILSMRVVKKIEIAAAGELKRDFHGELEETYGEKVASYSSLDEIKKEYRTNLSLLQTHYSDTQS